MLGEHEGSGEGLPTEAALERLLPSVVSHVVSEEMSVCKIFPKVDLFSCHHLKVSLRSNDLKQ